MEVLKKIQKNKDSDEILIYTEEQLMARLRFFIGVCLALTLTGIVFVVLYSLIFVTQPMNAISPIDQKFFELIVPIATFLTGTLSGIMLAGGDKDLREKALKEATKDTKASPDPTQRPPGSTGGFGASGGFGSAGGFSASANVGGASFGFNKPFGQTDSSAAGSFGGQPAAFGAPAQSSTVGMSASGKPMPMQGPEPEL